MGAAGSRRLSRGAAHGGPRRRARPPASTRRRSSASASTSPRRRRCPSCATARRCASCPSTAAGRTPTRSCGSTTPPRRRPSASPRWRRSAASRGCRATAGRISSEWQFAKALQVLEEEPEIYAAMDRWIEGADWIVWQLCGEETRNVCTAGYKGIHQDGALPVRGLPRRARRALRRLRGRQARAPARRRSAGAPAALTAEAAAWTGLPEGIAVAVGNVDAHVTAPAAQAIEPGQMVAIMGTSTLPRHEPRGARRGARDVRRRARRDHAGPVGLRGRPERRGGHLRLVRRPLRRARVPRGGRRARALAARAPLPAGGASRRSASTGSSRSTGRAATARCSSTTSSAA